ncbi:ankyrin repeat and SOCS box protein 2-like [Chanos chanos]|uniref:Ankyrin repeat and SOCS box protein 2-like n=1 Tax=Chanos chanos TaxID=29144 RepID=A0A6J2V6U3_CHACN|nr:ankyrin repeat and SOCS box protein 2-like [Chanos chanos]
MDAARLSVPRSTRTGVAYEDYSLYNKMSDEQLLQLAVERSLADANITPWRSQQIKSLSPSTAQCQKIDSLPDKPPPNPPSETQCEKIRRDPQSMLFIKDQEKVISWTRQNGHLRVTVEAMKELDPLLSAVWRGDANALREVLENTNRSLTEPNKNGWIPLHDAAYYGHVECLKILLKAKPDTINKRTSRNQTPLMLSAGRKHLDCVQYLLEKGADPTIANNQGETPLFKACEKPNEEIVNLLLKSGASATKCCAQGDTPLHEAVRNKHMDIAKMLLQAGAKLFARNIYGIDPLFTAAQTGASEVLKLLIKHGANINTEANDGATALYEASKNGHDEAVEILISKRADVNKPKKSGLLPLHIASKNGHYGIVCMLIPRTSRAKVRHSGISPLHLAAERNRDDVLELLIEAGFDVNATLSDDWSKMYEDRRSTALYFAVANRNIEGATMLLEAGANPNLDTFNPLLVAVRKGCIDMVSLLVEHGANVNALLPTYPTTFPGVMMFCMKYIFMLKYLMKNGCDATACFNCVYGNSPHPPIKMRQSGRNELHCISDEPPTTCVQFCEVMASPLNSPWAGPIIEVLLDYVGYVKLCARLRELLDNNNDWAHVKEKAMPPWSLVQLCRLKIRQQLGAHRLSLMNKLPLPGRLIKFLNYDEENLLFEDDL